MKKILTCMVSIALILSSVVTVFADEGKVTYNGNAQEFLFEPGSEYSPTDLFPDFKDVMPGDSLTQKITVKNDVSKNVKVKIYIRSLGTHEASVDFLSVLGLKVQKSEDNEMAYMFDAAANETAQLTDWVCLGTLYSGGEVNLDVILDVPLTLDNNYSKQIGYLDWEFMVEEFPVEEGDPQAPATGDNSQPAFWALMLLCSAAMMFILLIIRRKRRKEEKTVS